MQSKSRQPSRSSRLLLAYYGDDFTGSTDVMEALVRVGIRTVLFLTPPAPEQLRQFTGLRAFGVAGTARTLSPAQMDRELPQIFRRLGKSGAQLIHYKICSTFDSSPRTGSIGHAIELGQREFHSPFVPLVVGAPILGRYCVFGNLFARSGLDTEPHRLDRHPTMRCHPVTPMDESDLRVHLARQTRRGTHLFDVLKLAQGDQAVLPKTWLNQNGDIVLFDVLDPSNLPVIGRLIWSHRQEGKPLFAVGSSGIEYALCAHWKDLGQLPPTPAPPKLRAVKQLIAVSGSCSPVTERQIRYATSIGFAQMALDVSGLLDGGRRHVVLARARQAAARSIDRGKSVILHTCLGPGDPRLRRSSRGATLSARTLGTALGELLLQIMSDCSVRRAVVAGGDTSSYVARALGVDALEAIAPMAPGSPLCRVSSANSAIEGTEIVFKGGQVGRNEFFQTVLKGGDPSIWRGFA